jgi:hypothetical protein
VGEGVKEQEIYVMIFLTTNNRLTAVPAVMKNGDTFFLTVALMP